MGLIHFSRLSVYISATGFCSFKLSMSSNIPARMIVISLGSPVEFVFRPKIGVPSTCQCLSLKHNAMSNGTDHSPDRNN